jgi:agmatine/peptidylarginine deiminase
MTDEEKAMLLWENFTTPVSMRGIPEPPPKPVRHLAEWEELEVLAINWQSFTGTLREIVRHAKEQATVLIVADSMGQVNTIQSNLTSNVISLDNIEYVIAPNNSVWMRDYGPQCVYTNEIDSIYLIDYVYNRPSRPDDDLIPDAIGAHLDLPVYSMTGAPYDMVHTGGNFMSDGLGTGFSSRLVLGENEPGNIYGVGPHDEQDIRDLMKIFFGIDRYVLWENLPYDVIHHIDMHFKLLDEETILMGQYPEGIADGPQIEANLQYLLSKYMSPFGTPYRVVRILQPPRNGGYPPAQPYRTYTNSVFVNKTILVPVYEQQFDTIALRIYRENFPGYKVVGIDCNQIINSLGALHCVVKEIGVPNPLWIVHQRLRDVANNESVGDYQVDANIKHISGIAKAWIYYTTDTLIGYQSVPMTMTDADKNTWTAYIPHQPNGTEIFYYIGAEANSGKTQVRPLTAPFGYYRFNVDGVTVTNESVIISLKNIYPNPASAITVVPVKTNKPAEATIVVTDIFGRQMAVLFNGILPAGESNYFIQAGNYTPGTYVVTLKTADGIYSQKLIVRG